MHGKKGHFNSLRNQIFIGFVMVMLVVLLLAGISAYDRVAALLKSNAEKHIHQTAVQASGRLDAIIAQVNSLTAQVADDAYVQRLLSDEKQGNPATFNQRQALLQIAGSYQSFINGAQSMEIYTTGYNRIFPMDDRSLDLRVERNWINLADEGKGRLVWAGADPEDPGVLLAIRRINLLDHSFEHGGYVVVRMQRSFFQLNDSNGADGSQDSIMLLDGAGEVVTSDLEINLDPKAILDSGSVVQNGEESYIVVRQKSELTGWTLAVLTPLRETTEGVSILRTALLVSGMIGVVLFLIMSFFLSTMITRPLIRLMRAMRSAQPGAMRPNLMVSSTMEINELNDVYNQMVYRQNELTRVVHEKEIMQSRAELKALQSQINPHFLFNTLEAFYWSLEEKGDEEMARMVVAMSRLFRYIISSSQQDEWVTIADELEHAERYLQIMQMRLGERMQWEIQLSDTVRKVAIPKLLIQPLVENAILHGIESKLGPGKISIHVDALTEKNLVRIKVRDDGPGMDELRLQSVIHTLHGGPAVSKKGTGVGLINVHRRLMLYFGSQLGERCKLSITSKVGEGTVICFEIPMGTEGAYDS
ncbi:integral membrane sensor signal transduction histidine kinase [Paenibacillus sp. FSL R5-192]|uniref:cache domain-containing sensor histidine kinase n=1 Tax=Paenibacillus sp. FSL R5-192 TaxID=1226754 RepID=UPI0003E299EE|nr:sensor histidine kinase [Paenibacillus sp. FSL R5-192]ETT35364.1 integral membrane sensor signal transduction histidine kinase [Paenibacillus sp. FSL R5-192]